MDSCHCSNYYTLWTSKLRANFPKHHPWKVLPVTNMTHGPNFQAATEQHEPNVLSVPLTRPFPPSEHFGSSVNSRAEVGEKSWLLSFPMSTDFPCHHFPSSITKIKFLKHDYIHIIHLLKNQKSTEHSYLQRAVYLPPHRLPHHHPQWHRAFIKGHTLIHTFLLASNLGKVTLRCHSSSSRPRCQGCPI